MNDEAARSKVEKVRLEDCALNLGELHRHVDLGFFNPEFHCVTEDGARFVAKMRLLVGELLERLLIADPRAFEDGGFAANSVHSISLKRKVHLDDAVLAGERVRRPELLANVPLYEIDQAEICRALLKGYDVERECASDFPSIDRPEVAFTCHDPRIVGGGNQVLFRFVNWLDELGVRVTIYSCGGPATWTRVNAKFRTFSSYEEMFRAVDESVVVLYSMWHIEPMLKSATRGKRIYHLRQICEKFHYGSCYQNMKVAKPVIELLESLPIGTITVSPHLHDWYKQNSGLESFLITNGIDGQMFFPSRERDRSKVRRLVIVSVGNPNHFVKGADVLARALERLATRRSDLDLEWILAFGDRSGEGADIDVQSDRVRINTKINLTAPQMRALYQSADLVVDPSHYEGFGLPVLEAMACGTPVVHADNCGLDGIVEDGRDCLVVPVNDADAMADAIERLLTDDALAEQLRAGGLRTAAEQSIENQLGAFVPAFEQMLGTKFPASHVQRMRTRLSARGGAQAGPLVSVVIPTYNQAEYLSQALDSLRAQSYTNWEAVVVNDGSTDDTEQVLQEIASAESRVKVFSQPNGGITSALNRGLEEARGELFCWLSSDDLFYPQKLESQVRAFEDLGEEVALVYGSFDILQEETGTVEEQPLMEPLTPGSEFPEALKFDFIDGCTVMIRLDLMRDVGGFNPHYRHAQDMELWMRIASRGYRFRLLPEKLTIRRVHQEQASTANMIYCRYDAAWMIHYYLERFHLLEMYRYFDFTAEADIDRFLEHFVARVVETEANVNHPLLRAQFWEWFSRGIEAFGTETQDRILRKCFGLLHKRLSACSRVAFYYERCLDALAEERVHRPYEPDFSDLRGRDIRNDNRSKDDFATDLMNYGLALLVNEHTPLFAQELYFHNTHKVVDTPYKLAHSVFRYLSQFENPYQDLVSPHAGMERIPGSETEALHLFCALACPDDASELEMVIDLLQDAAGAPDAIEACEKRLLADLRPRTKETLARFCAAAPTSTFLHYLHASSLAHLGSYLEALEEGFKTLTLGHTSCNGWIALRLGQWAEEAGDLERAFAAYNAAAGKLRDYEPLEAGLRRTSRSIQLLKRYKPRVKQLCRGDDARQRGAHLVECDAVMTLQGNYILHGTSEAKDGERFRWAEQLPYGNHWPVQVQNPGTQEKVSLEAADIFALWSAGYDYGVESQTFYRELITGEDSRRVAFTLRSGSVMGGGPMVVLRYVDWLSELGVEVTIYSDDHLPQWASLKGRFRHIEDDAERYASISEPVVIAYSVLELPSLLRHCDTKGKRILHLCQGVEEFNYHSSNSASLMASKPIFQLLHSLPVGRIAVSDHLETYFSSEYGQRTHTIRNGINLTKFSRLPRRPKTKTVNVMTVGSPKRLLKGASDVKQALTLLARKRPDWELHLDIVSGQKITRGAEPGFSSIGFTCTVHDELDASQVEEMYRAADIYVNAAWYEGFGLPTLEAMACGIPVVQVDNRGLEGVVKNDVNCLVVAPERPDQIAEALLRINAEPGTRERLVAEGMRTAARYSARAQHEAFVAELETILCCKFDAHRVTDQRERLSSISLSKKQSEFREAMQPLYSIIVPTYNQAPYLQAALDSLLAQSYRHWEAIVVNDGSTDETPLILERYAARDARFRVFHKRNGGLSSTLNEALKHARGTWICFLSSDNLFDPSMLAVHRSASAEYPETCFFHSAHFDLNETSGLKTLATPGWNGSLPEDELQKIGFFFGSYVSWNTVSLHRSVFEETGFFRDDLPHGQHFDFFLRVASRFKSHFIAHATSTRRLHSDQRQYRLRSRAADDVGRACLEHLNATRFDELFPLLELAKPEQARFALDNTLGVLFAESALVNQCGFGSALASRMRDWLSDPSRAELRQWAGLEVSKRLAVSNGFPEEKTKETLLSLTESSPTRTLAL